MLEDERGLSNVPKVVGGDIYYGMFEACKKAGISKGTYYRWLKAGILNDVSHRDRRGWRLFGESDISKIKAEANNIAQAQEGGTF